MLEQVVNVVVGDNLDLGCTVIERAATDKAIRDVDKLLQSAYEERAKARSQGKTFADTTPFHGRWVVHAGLREGGRGGGNEQAGGWFGRAQGRRGGGLSKQAGWVVQEQAVRAAGRQGGAGPCEGVGGSLLANTTYPFALF